MNPVALIEAHKTAALVIGGALVAGVAISYLRHSSPASSGQSSNAGVALLTPSAAANYASGMAVGSPGQYVVPQGSSGLVISNTYSPPVAASTHTTSAQSSMPTTMAAAAAPVTQASPATVHSTSAAYGAPAVSAGRIYPVAKGLPGAGSTPAAEAYLGAWSNPATVAKDLGVPESAVDYRSASTGHVYTGIQNLKALAPGNVWTVK